MKSLKNVKVGELVTIVDKFGVRSERVRRVTQTKICVGPFRGRMMNGLISYNKKTGIMQGCLPHNKSVAFVPENRREVAVGQDFVLAMVEEVYQAL